MCISCEKGVEKSRLVGYTALTMKKLPQIQDGFPHRLYEKNSSIHLCFSENMSELAKEEAHHHDHDEDDPIETHQLTTYRNTFYHARIWDRLKRLERGSHILEIGAGSGFDAKEFADAYALTLSDVSPETLNRTYAKMGEKATYVAADGEHLPFAHESFDAVYMIAVFHHFEKFERALSECVRVLKPGGQIIIGIEPNSFYFKPLKYVQGILYKITKTDPHHISKADQQMTGFSRAQLLQFFSEASLIDIDITPVWFLAGWVHYILEFIFRTFSLRKRIVLPRFFEKVLVSVDEFFFSLPFFKHLCWHWTVMGKKPE